MKYVQIGILVSLIVIAGLLLAIYRADTVPAPASPSGESLVLAEDFRDFSPRPEELISGKTFTKPNPLPNRTDEPSQEQPPEPRASQPPKREAPAKVETPADSVKAAPARNPEVPQAAAPPPVAMAKSSPAPQPAPPPPPEPRIVTLPAGMELPVRLVHSLSSDRNLAGDTFYATLEDDLIVDNLVVARKNARLEGRVANVERAGKVKGVSLLSIELVRMHTADGQTIDIVTNRFTRQGRKSRKEDAKKVGIGAGIGAAIGAIAGGGKGAAIGAAAGAGAGSGQVLMTRGKPVVLSSETPLTFRLIEQVRIVEDL